MLATVQALFLNTREGIYEDKSKNINIDYRHINLGAIDDSHQGQIITFSLLKDLDISSLVPYETYSFIVDLPQICRDKGKLKVVGFVPIK